MQIRQNVKLSDILWYKIGGIAKYLILCESKEDIRHAIEFIKHEDINKIFIVGLGSNLLFHDGYFDGAVIQITTEMKTPKIRLTGENEVEAFAGVLLDDVITYTFANNLTGLEWAGGLPGTSGAAVRGNVGAYGGEVKDNLLSAEVMILDGQNKFEIKKFTNEELNFSYRNSLIKDNPGKMIVLSAIFALKPGTKDEIIKARSVYEEHIKQRGKRHPLEYPNCGSVFKNIREPEKIAKILTVFPEIKDKIEKLWYGKIASAYLIQQLGLQGYRIGDAQVSEKHALFIVNLGHAKAEEVLKVINTIQSKFQETFGFKLETEIEIVI